MSKFELCGWQFFTIHRIFIINVNYILGKSEYFVDYFDYFVVIFISSLK